VNRIALFLTENGNGEPIAMLHGMSVWSTVALRSLGIILTIYVIWRAQLSLHKNLMGIAGDMKLGRNFPAPQDGRSWWTKVASAIGISLESNESAQPVPLKVEAAWSAYLRHERFWPRCWRACFYTAMMVLIFYTVLVPLFGGPDVPVRGELAAGAYYWTTLLDVLLILFLTLFIFDATCSCLNFVNKLRAGTRWPPNTLEHYNSRLRLQSELVHDWISLEFVAKRTRCVGSLNYYPFALIALLIISGSTVFANFAPSLTIPIALGISLSAVFGCAIMLSFAAKRARDVAKQNFTDAIIAAKGHLTTAGGKGSNAIQKDPDDGGRYAAQLEALLSRIDQLNEGAFSPSRSSRSSGQCFCR
jgi:hypothetical protein